MFLIFGAIAIASSVSQAAKAAREAEARLRLLGEQAEALAVARELSNLLESEAPRADLVEVRLGGQTVLLRPATAAALSEMSGGFRNCKGDDFIIALAAGIREAAQ
jgi:plasmid stabilization system protein ParE